MKTYLLPLVGIVLGAMIAFYIFAMLFISPKTDLFPKVLLPFGLAGVVSFALAWLDPNKWKVLAASVALPTLLMVVLTVIGLWTESRSDWSWALVAAASLCVCIVPSWFAHKRRTKVA
jgi:uncharacterized membrane protein